MIAERRWYQNGYASFVLFGAIFVLGCTSEANASGGMGANGPSVDAVRNLEVARDEALAGDQVAAAHLQGVYSKTDQEQYLYWLEIGAENGHSISQYNLAFELWAHGNAPKADQIRAKFWLGRAAATGDSEAAAVLARLKNGGEW